MAEGLPVRFDAKLFGRINQQPGDHEFDMKVYHDFDVNDQLCYWHFGMMVSWLWLDELLSRPMRSQKLYQSMPVYQANAVFSVLW